MSETGIKERWRTCPISAGSGLCPYKRCCAGARVRESVARLGVRGESSPAFHYGGLDHNHTYSLHCRLLSLPQISLTLFSQVLLADTWWTMDTVSTLKVQVHTGVVHHIHFHQHLTTRKFRHCTNFKHNISNKFI